MLRDEPAVLGLRDYGIEGQLGLESTPEEYVGRLVEVFREVRRVLTDDGTLWLNLGDCYNAYNGNAGPSSGFSAGSASDSQRPKLLSGHGLRTARLKPKDLVGIPWRVAFALQSDGWWLRSDIIWSKPNPMPESVTDRPTRSHEYIFLLSKSERYFYDADAIRERFTSSHSDLRKMIEQKDRIGGLTKEQTDPLLRASALTNMGRKRSAGSALGAADEIARRKTALNPHAGGRRQAPEPGEPSAFHENGRNIRSVWTIATARFPQAHFATFPEELARRCILAGSAEGDLVLDPFTGAGTTGLVALKAARRFVGIELNPEYVAMAEGRLAPLIAQTRML